MTPAEVQRLNRQLAPQGRRLCAACGHEGPLADFPAFHSAGRVWYRTLCRACSRRAWRQDKLDRKSLTFFRRLEALT